MTEFYGELEKHAVVDRNNNLGFGNSIPMRFSHVAMGMGSGPITINITVLSQFEKISDPVNLLQSVQQGPDVIWNDSLQRFEILTTGVYKGEFFLNWTSSIGNLIGVTWGVNVSGSPVFPFMQSSSVLGFPNADNGFSNTPLSAGDTMEFFVANDTNTTDDIVISAIQLCMSKVG